MKHSRMMFLARAPPRAPQKIMRLNLRHISPNK